MGRVRKDLARVAGTRPAWEDCILSLEDLGRGSPIPVIYGAYRPIPIVSPAGHVKNDGLARGKVLTPRRFLCQDYVAVGLLLGIEITDATARGRLLFGYMLVWMAKGHRKKYRIVY